MREIVLDTETTGLDPASGDRVVEIGCLELVNHVPTGRHYHQYINPERDMPADAFAVHGLSAEFLSEYPVFAGVADAFLDFIEGGKLVIHNAAFDIKFLNHELGRLEKPQIAFDCVIDSLDLARRRHPFGPNSLDALCKRYGVDNSARTLHGALLDCELLADVYLELVGGRQPGLGLDAVETRTEREDSARNPAAPRPKALPPRLTEDEMRAHEAFVAELGADALWSRYGVGDPAKPDAD